MWGNSCKFKLKLSKFKLIKPNLSVLREYLVNKCRLICCLECCLRNWSVSSSVDQLQQLILEMESSYYIIRSALIPEIRAFQVTSRGTLYFKATRATSLKLERFQVTSWVQVISAPAQRPVNIFCGSPRVFLKRQPAVTCFCYHSIKYALLVFVSHTGMSGKRRATLNVRFRNRHRLSTWIRMTLQEDCSRLQSRRNWAHRWSSLKQGGSAVSAGKTM